MTTYKSMASDSAVRVICDKEHDFYSMLSVNGDLSNSDKIAFSDKLSYFVEWSRFDYPAIYFWIT